MLIVKRRAGQRIIVDVPASVAGRRIVVEVGRTDGQGTKVAIDAPRDVSVMREELVRTISAEEHAAMDELNDTCIEG